MGRIVHSVTTLRVVWIEILRQIVFILAIAVTTLRVVWIEISPLVSIPAGHPVTTLRVVWIEISALASSSFFSRSPPCGWCGLKFLSLTMINCV